MRSGLGLDRRSPARADAGRDRPRHARCLDPAERGCGGDVARRARPARALQLLQRPGSGCEDGRHARRGLGRSSGAGPGAGWHDPEYEAFGFPTIMVSRFAEALEIVVRLLRGERVSFDGRYHQLSDAVLLPPPERSIPILVAGRKPRMLRLTASWADAWNTAWYAEPNDKLQAEVEAFERALEDTARAGERDPANARDHRRRRPGRDDRAEARHVGRAGLRPCHRRLRAPGVGVRRAARIRRAVVPRRLR